MPADEGRATHEMKVAGVEILRRFGFEVRGTDVAGMVWAAMTAARPAAAPAPGVVEQKPRPYPFASKPDSKVSEAFMFEGGTLTVCTQGYGEADGHGWFCFPEKEINYEQAEDSEKMYVIADLYRSEILALRDQLNTLFPAPATPIEAQAGEARPIMAAWNMGAAVPAEAGQPAAQGPDALDARRYRRLRVMGCAVMDTPQLENGTVVRFTGLDSIVDEDLKFSPSRGEPTTSALEGKAG